MDQVKFIMARMHSDDRGQSGSTKPVEKNVPEWVDYSEEEVIDLVTDLAQEGYDPSQIGIILRDKHGIPSVKEITGHKLTGILEENEMAPEMPEDLNNLVEKAEKIQDHLEENPNDRQSIRRLELTEAKIRKVAQYHRDKGNIEENWKYSRRE